MTKRERAILGYNLDNPEESQKLHKILSEGLARGESVGEILEVPKETLEKVYGLAYQKYYAGQYSEAIDLFNYLTVFDGKRYEYALGLAACYQKKGDLKEATSTYLYASFLNPEDPVPYFHGAACYEGLGDTEMAIGGLQLAIATAGDDEKYAELVSRARLTIEGLITK